MRFALTLATALLLAACDGGGAKINLNTGDAAPGFATRQLAGGTVKFPEDLAGKPVVLRFWADWCRFCEGEMKDIEQVYRRRQSEGLNVLAVNVGQNEKTVADFMKKIAVSYPALIDEEGGIARQYGVIALPTTFFVDGQGKVRAKILGEADAATFERVAAELLK
jgi:peroxiredoxin